MSDPIVKARLSIEQEGEPQVFREAAASVGELGTSAGQAAPSLDGLISGLEQLSQSVEGTAAAKRAVNDFVEALRELKDSPGLDEQREAVDRALDAWKRLGQEIPEVLDASSSAAREYQETLERLQEVQEELAEPLTQGLARAEDAFASLNDSVEGNMSGVGEKLAQARRRVDEYRDALDAARRAGQSVTGGQEQELARLETRYAEATRAIGRYAAAKREAEKDINKARLATQAEIGSINSLSDVFGAASPKVRAFSGAVGQLIDAFRAGYEAGEALRAMLNQLSDGGFDRAVQGLLHMEQAADRLVDGLDRASRAGEELANQRRIFEALGLDGFSADVEKNAAVLQAHSRAVAADRSEAAKLKDEVDKLSRSVGLNRVELDKQAATLAETLNAFAAQNRQLSTTDLGTIFGPMIQRVLDSYARLKVEVPPALASIAASWNVTTTAAANAAARHRQTVEALVADITGVSRVNREVLNGMANDLLNALSKLNLFRLDPEQFERARANVQSLVDAYTAAGERIPPALAQVAGQLRIFQSESDLTTTKTKAAAIASTEFGSAIQRAGESTVRAAKDLETGRASIENVAPASNQAQISLADLMAKYGEAGRAARAAGEQARQGAEATASGAGRLTEVSTSYQEIASAADSAGEKVGGAATKISEVARQLNELGRVDANLTKPASEVESLSASIDTLKAQLGGLLGDFGKFVALDSVFGPVLSGLREVIDLVNAARNAVNSLTGGDNG